MPPQRSRQAYPPFLTWLLIASAWAGPLGCERAAVSNGEAAPRPIDLPPTQAPDAAADGGADDASHPGGDRDASAAPTVICRGARLAPGDGLTEGEALCSADGACQLALTAGDLSLSCGDVSRWRAGVQGATRLRMQGDGNLVLRDGSDRALWSTETAGQDGAALTLEREGRTATVRDARGCSLWHAGEPPEPCAGPAAETACDGPVDRSHALLESGPMVGHTTITSAHIWAFAPQAKAVTLAYRRRGACDEPARQVTMTDHGGGTTLTQLTGLRPQTPYEYRLSLDGEAAADGSFVTAPEGAQGKRFRYMFGSCARIQRHPDQPVWGQVMAQRPAFQIINGDAVYADTTDYDGLWRRHMQQRAEPGFAALIRNVPTYAVWDDHDYGPNNADGNAAGKEDSLRAFTHLWANPAYGTADTPGVFFTLAWGDVEFFVVDNRYHRMTAEDYIGRAQLDWLKDGLAGSEAIFKIIVHGGTIRRAGDESWFTRDAERTELLDFIRARGITGVLFHGGDVHKNHFNPYPKCPAADAPHYDVFEIISSGLTYAARYTMVDVDTTTTPTLTYTFYQDGQVHEVGRLTVEADGRMKHELVERSIAASDACQEKSPTFAYPR